MIYDFYTIWGSSKYPTSVGECKLSTRCAWGGQFEYRALLGPCQYWACSNALSTSNFQREENGLMSRTNLNTPRVLGFPETHKVYHRNLVFTSPMYK